MGYYTEYSLEVNHKDELKIIEQLRAENENTKYAFCNFGEANDAIKWYDHEKDLREFSKKHSTAIFTLKGNGEESGDIWVKYFKNGKMQASRAKLVFDKFDKNLLK